MSGAARHRGGGRAAGGNDTSSETSSRPSRPSRRGNRHQGPGGFDGPASRGSASNTAPSVGSGRGSPNAPQGGPISPPSQRQSSGQSQSFSANQPTSGLLVDPARDNPPRPTDALRNVDLPASFYAIDKLVSASSVPEQPHIPPSAASQCTAFPLHEQSFTSLSILLPPLLPVLHVPSPSQPFAFLEFPEPFAFFHHFQLKQSLSQCTHLCHPPPFAVPLICVFWL